MIAYTLLGILHQQPSYGYELKQKYDELFSQQKPLAFGQIYATLSRLLRDQKVRIVTTEQQAGPERKKYALTPLGQENLEAWLELPQAFQPQLQPVFFAKVVSALLMDKSPQVFLDAQRAAHMAAMRDFTNQRRAGDLRQTLQADYALFHLEADLRWLEIASQRIEILKQEVKKC